jgi:uncharacterized Zn finger protein (UPF0148 family)
MVMTKAYVQPIEVHHIDIECPTCKGRLLTNTAGQALCPTCKTNYRIDTPIKGYRPTTEKWTVEVQLTPMDRAGRVVSNTDGSRDG